MAENSKIEWTDHTFNPWVGCTKVGPGCDHCYAESWAKRTGNPDLWHGMRRRTSDANWRKPHKWNREAAERGVRYRVFCASLADVFDNAAPHEWRVNLFAMIAATPHLDWLLLTKRIGNVAKALPLDWGDGWPNVWLGATIVNQEEADRDMAKLLATNARVRFLSMEPLLGPVDLKLSRRNTPLRRLDWVIVGGESGHGARPMHEDWAFEIAYQCAENDVSFFMKQGSAANWPSYKDFESFPGGLRVRQFPN